VLDIALCVYLAVSVCSSQPRRPLILPYAEVPLAGEVTCGRPYLSRLLRVVDSLELEQTTLYRRKAVAKTRQETRVLVEEIEDIDNRLQRVHVAYVGCHVST